MSVYKDEIAQSRAEQRFLEELDQGVRLANQEIIHERIPNLDKERALVFAATVARLRADYLDLAFKQCVAGTDATAADLAALRQKRELYEEARDAFAALRQAIERGYIDIALMDDRTDAA